MWPHQGNDQVNGICCLIVSRCVCSTESCWRDASTALSASTFPMSSRTATCASASASSRCSSKSTRTFLSRFGRQGYATKKQTKLECGPMPNVMVALPNIGGALCSTPQSFADAHYYMPCSNAAKTRKTLKIAGVPQTPETISAASGSKFTIL